MAGQHTVRVGVHDTLGRVGQYQLGYFHNALYAGAAINHEKPRVSLLARVASGVDFEPVRQPLNRDRSESSGERLSHAFTSSLSDWVTGSYLAGSGGGAAR